jgi:hypothetical protein
MSLGFEASIWKIQGFVCIKQFQDWNEKQNPVTQKLPELIQMQIIESNDEKQISVECSEDRKTQHAQRN